MNEPNKKRPWDKTFSRGKNSNISDVNSTTPFVHIDGIPYYSDRFYLNAPTGLTKSPASVGTTHDPKLCKCQCPPPLFDRSRLIKSLDLVAVILSTYVIDPNWIQQELPMLFPSNSTTVNDEYIPTLVLHGHRGLSKKKFFQEGRSNLHSHLPKIDEETMRCNSCNRVDAISDDTNHRCNTDINDSKSVPLKEVDTAACSTPGIAKGNNTERMEHQYKDTKVSIEPRHKHGRTYEYQDGNTDTFRQDAQDTLLRIESDDNAKDPGSNHPEKSSMGRKPVEEVLIIEIDDKSDAESENYDDEIQMIKCVPAPLKSEKNSEIKTLRCREVCESPGMDVASLATKHRRNLYKSPVYRHSTTDIDTDQESVDQSKNEGDLHCITPLSFSDIHLDDIPPEEGWRKTNPIDDASTIGSIFGKSVYLTEILPRWIPSTQSGYNTTKGKENLKHKISQGRPNHIVDLVDDSSLEGDNVGVDPKHIVDLVDDSSLEEDNIGVDSDTIMRRKSCVGVHHPKYMLLFERRGSIVVIVSTSNLTRPSAVDGSWIQRFEPTFSTKDEHYKSSSNTESDFGYVLCDFLQRQSDAAKENQILPIQFLRKYLGLRSLDDFCRTYRFDEARAHLVSTVPGSFPRRPRGRKKSPSRISRRVIYGPQRVAEITTPMYQKHNDKKINKTESGSELSDEITRNGDRLILQTTSFGSNWRSCQFEDLARIYLGLDSSDSFCVHARKNLLDRVDLVWPSQDFVKAIVNERHNYSSTELYSDLSPENFTFLSTKAFNSIDLECVSCMTQYELCNPSPIAPWIISPHIKTIARVLEDPKDDRHGVNLRNREVNNSANFAWIMLTSACISRGAQGVSVEEKGFGQERIIHTNFELGVLFCSKLNDNRITDRLYNSYPPKCTCHKKISSNEPLQYSRNTISLPIPYKIQSLPYQLDPDEADFAVTPCFHEITPGTEVTGQMMLTPLGKKKSAQHSITACPQG